MPFDRFAAQRIRGAILDAVRAADWAPRSVRNLARKLESVEQRLATELGRVPSSREMAEALGMTAEELSRLQDRMFRSVVLALEHEVNEDSDEDLTLVDVLSDRSTLEPLEELESRELHAYLRDAVNLLPERQRLVIVGYFLEGRTLAGAGPVPRRDRVPHLPAALRGAADAAGGHRGPVQRHRRRHAEHRPGRPPQGHLRRRHRRRQRLAGPPGGRPRGRRPGASPPRPPRSLPVIAKLCNCVIMTAAKRWTIGEVSAWFAGRLPDTWFAGRP